MIVVAITGASGVTYGIRLLEALKELKIETSLIISDAAQTVIKYECNTRIEDIIDNCDNYYDFHDLTSSINSGSFKFDSLVIVPCSMKTLASIAHGYGANTITRAADVALKERRFTASVWRAPKEGRAGSQTISQRSKEAWNLRIWVYRGFCRPDNE